MLDRVILILYQWQVISFSSIKSSQMLTNYLSPSPIHRQEAWKSQVLTGFWSMDRSYGIGMDITRPEGDR